MHALHKLARLVGAIAPDNLRSRVRRQYDFYEFPLVREAITDTAPYHAQYWWDNNYWHGTPITDAYSIDTETGDGLTAAIAYRAIEQAMLVALDQHAGGLPVDGRVIDLGSGAGRWCQFWDGLGADSVIGCDIADRAVTAADQRFEDKADIQITQADIAAGVPAADQSAVVVSAVNVLGYIPDDERFQSALDEIARVLASDGIALATGAAGWLSYNQSHEDRHDAQPPGVIKRVRSWWHWSRAAKRAGLRVVDTIPVRSPDSSDVVDGRLLVLAAVGEGRGESDE